MKALTLALVLPIILLAFLSSCTIMDVEPPNDESQVFKKPKPDFPQAELEQGREGWVLVAYHVGRSGIVDDAYVMDSSGNSTFEGTALSGVREWRYAPGEERELSVLVSFVDDQDETPLSQKFYTLNRKAHKLIDEGELERAEELLAEAREDEDLHPSELAYSFVTEARIAGERGDRGEQLHYCRKAMLDNGRWLERSDYHGILYSAVILSLDQGDFVTAVRDYELLTESRSGRKRAEDLDEIVQAAKTRVEADLTDIQPYAVANSSMTVLGRLSGERYRPMGRQQQRQPSSGRHDSSNTGKYTPRSSDRN